MNKMNLTLEQKDVKNHLHPYTDARLHESTGPLIIERGEGIHVYDNHGKQYIEAMSGLWSVALGFSNPRLIEAAEKQLRTLPFYHLFTSKAHAPSIELAEKLIELAPVPMSKVFFTNSGSEAVDLALRVAMAATGRTDIVQFYANVRERGTPRYPRGVIDCVPFEPASRADPSAR